MTAPLAIAMRPTAVPTIRARRATRFATAAITLAAVSSSLVLPVGALAFVFVLATLWVAGVALSAAPVRELRMSRAARRQRRQRRAARERILPLASFGRDTLAELTRLVDEIELADPEVAQRFDLEGLLDRHVGLTLGHERALRAVAMSDRTQLARMRESYRADPRAHPRRVEMCDRRIKCQLACEQAADWYADELAIVSDLIRLLAQRVACPEETAPDDIVERQLAELDEDEAARRLLASELH